MKKDEGRKKRGMRQQGWGEEDRKEEGMRKER